jgi:hypothetical protein
MANFQPTGIQLHLTTGRKHMFYQEDVELIAKICDNLDGQIFSRASLIIDSVDEVTAFPGHALMGITILIDPLPACIFERERLSKTVVAQISFEAFQSRRLDDMSKVEGQRGAVLSELEFVSGERLFLESSEIAASAMAERNALHHLFSRPSLSCRRLGCGFSVWNTAHIVSWSHYPKLKVPSDAWRVDSLSELVPNGARNVRML